MVSLDIFSTIILPAGSWLSMVRLSLEQDRSDTNVNVAMPIRL